MLEDHPAETKLYQIDTGYACFGIVIYNDIVVSTAPIAKWAMYKKVKEVLDYYKKKGAKICLVNG